VFFGLAVKIAAVFRLAYNFSARRLTLAAWGSKTWMYLIYYVCEHVSKCASHSLSLFTWALSANHNHLSDQLNIIMSLH